VNWSHAFALAEFKIYPGVGHGFFAVLPPKFSRGNRARRLALNAGLVQEIQGVGLIWAWFRDGVSVGTGSKTNRMSRTSSLALMLRRRRSRRLEAVGEGQSRDLRSLVLRDGPFGASSGGGNLSPDCPERCGRGLHFQIRCAS